MHLIESEYEAIRASIRPGDMIAFSGKGTFSEIIKSVTRSGVSHVAAVLKTEQHDIPRVQVIESTSLNGFVGVSISYLSQRIHNYDGEMWWFRLSDGMRECFNEKAYYEWLLKQHNKEYDLGNAIKAGLDVLGDFGGLTYAKEDFSKLFCSELMAGAYVRGEVITHLNASEVIPKDLTRFNLWQEYYYQIKGLTRQLRGCGTIDPEGFGV